MLKKKHFWPSDRGERHYRGRGGDSGGVQAALWLPGPLSRLCLRLPDPPGAPRHRHLLLWMLRRHPRASRAHLKLLLDTRLSVPDRAGAGAGDLQPSQPGIFKLGRQLNKLTSKLWNYEKFLPGADDLLVSGGRLAGGRHGGGDEELQQGGL